MFERFTDQARRVLVLAQEEARSLRHDFIGTEHMLLGLVREGGSLGARALADLGVTLDAARARVMEKIGPAPGPAGDPADDPPFTPRAKKVLELSLREALQLGHSHIRAEHILLGLVREAEGVAAQVLVELGAQLSEVRHKVIEMLLEDATAGHLDQPLVEDTDTPSTGGQVAAETPPPASPGDPPRCPHCRAGLADQAAYRTLSVPADAEHAELHTFGVVYCRACGRALAFRPEP